MAKVKKSFDEWLNEVDNHLKKLCGMWHNDLPDCLYRDWYDEGIPSAKAANKAYKNAREEMGF